MANYSSDWNSKSIKDLEEAWKGYKGLKINRPDYETYIPGTTYIPVPKIRRRRRRIIIIEEEVDYTPYWGDAPYSEPCMHQSCPDCFGTGRKANGQMCLHMMSCPCPRCTPRYY